MADDIIAQLLKQLREARDEEHRIGVELFKLLKAECPECRGYGYYTYPGNDQRHVCAICEGIGKVTEERRESYIATRNRTRLSWEPELK